MFVWKYVHMAPFCFHDIETLKTDAKINWQLNAYLSTLNTLWDYNKTKNINDIDYVLFTV